MPSRCDEETKAKAIRLFRDHAGDYDSPWAAMCAISGRRGPWETGGRMSTASRRAVRRRNGLPNWRIVRYADDFAFLTDGTEQDTQARASRPPTCWPYWGYGSPTPKPVWCT